MYIAKRRNAILGTASVLAVFALSGAAVAEVPAEKTYDAAADKAQQAENTMQKHKKMAEERKQDAMEKASAFGVSDLGEIEDWEITHEGNEIGSIDRLGIDRDTGEFVAIVGLEGVLGANMKEVAIPLEKLEKAGDETLSTNLTKAELQKERDIDPWDGTFTQVLQGELTQ